MSRRFALTSTAFLCFVIGTSCSSGGPEPPRPGTAAFFWQAAKENYQAGDYLKTVDHLDKILRIDNPFAVQARPIRLVFASALANTYRELADQYDQGGRTNKNNPAPFRKKGSDYRSAAERAAMAFAESYSGFQKAQPAGEVAYAFGYPPRGSSGMPAVINKIAQGQAPTESDITSAETAMIQRGVLNEICAAAGATKDPAKAQQVLKTPPVQLNRGAFEAAMASALYESSTLFSPLKGSQPARQAHLLDLASQALGRATGDEKELKELKKKIERDQKDAKKKAS